MYFSKNSGQAPRNLGFWVPVGSRSLCRIIELLLNGEALWRSRRGTTARVVRTRTHTKIEAAFRGLTLKRTSDARDRYGIRSYRCSSHDQQYHRSTEAGIACSCVSKHCDISDGLDWLRGREIRSRVSGWNATPGPFAYFPQISPCLAGHWIVIGLGPRPELRLALVLSVVVLVVS